MWPLTAGRTNDGVLTIGGCRADDLVRRFGSPLYVLDREDVLSQARAYIDAYVNVGDEPRGEVFYAGKAFLSITVAKWLLATGINLDVCTEGELATALAAGAQGDQILMHGNNKSEAELTLAVNHGVRFVVVDSMDEIVRLAALADAAGVRVSVLVRVTVGVDAHTHEYIMTAHEDQKFGFSIANGAAQAAVDAVVLQKSLHFAGLHSHIGSQIFDTGGFVIAAERLADFAKGVLHRHSINVDYLNIGGGTGIAYVDADDPQNISAFAAAMRKHIRELFTERGLPLPTVIVEPGRSIIGRAGVTLYTVGTTKEVETESGTWRRYIAVDGGMSDNIRTALYDADYTVTTASSSLTPETQTVLSRVVGKHCESGDIIVKDAMLPRDARPGDLLAVAATGAYCFSLSSNYNHIVRPAVVAVDGGRAELLIRRETIRELLSRDAGLTVEQDRVAADRRDGV